MTPAFSVSCGDANSKFYLFFSNFWRSETSLLFIFALQKKKRKRSVDRLQRLYHILKVTTTASVVRIDSSACRCRLSISEANASDCPKLLRLPDHLPRIIGFPITIIPSRASRLPLSDPRIIAPKFFKWSHPEAKHRNGIVVFTPWTCRHNPHLWLKINSITLRPHHREHPFPRSQLWEVANTATLHSA